jgi:hypothetical protein
MAQALLMLHQQIQAIYKREEKSVYEQNSKPIITKQKNVLPNSLPRAKVVTTTNVETFKVSRRHHSYNIP